MRSYRLGYFPGLLAQSANYFLVCMLAWISIPAAHAEDTACEATGATRIWVSPLNPKIDEPVKIMVVSTDGPASELILIDSQGQRISLQSRRRGGPPWSLIAGLERLNAGQYRIETNRDGKLIACHTLTLDGSGQQERPQAWNFATEAFYSAWIEALFGAPPEENLAFNSLEPLLRNTERNFLHNHLGINEDNNLPLTPDCADLPYTCLL